MKKMKKFVVLLLAVVMAISMNITVFAGPGTVVDYSACPYCGYLWAELYDSGQPLMKCPECGYTDSTWNCCSRTCLIRSTGSPYSTYSEYLAHIAEASTWVKSNNKSAGYIENRGWTHQSINNLYNSPFTTRTAVDKSTNEPATAYYNVEGDYIVVNNFSRELVQLSEYGNRGWIPDNTIVDPYYSN